MTISTHRLDELESFFLELHAATASITLPLFRGAHDMKNKGGERGFDPVTKADRDAEEAIRKLVATRFPEHGVIGEEHGSDRPDAEFVWVLDPVDGTRSFVAGLPLWTTLIALRYQGKPIVGSIGQPFLGEIYLGRLGDAPRARLVTKDGDKPLRVRPCASVSECVIASTDPHTYFSIEERGGWNGVRKDARMARLGCDGYAMAMVAAGTIDLVVEAGLHAWDVEGPLVVVRGAGGVVMDWKGADPDPKGGRVIFAGDRACADDALRVLSAV